jgi:hypothetical protein
VTPALTPARGRVTPAAVLAGLVAAALVGAGAAVVLWLALGGRPAAAPTPNITPTAAAPTRPLYEVARTWPDDGTGAGATLVVTSESHAQSQAAIRQYLNAHAGQEYLWVEVLGHADATRWTCAGEYFAKPADLERAVFDMSKAFVTFPADWIECR